MLSQVLIDTLKSKSDLSASLDQLKESAVQRGFILSEKKPGRVIHFAMLGMEQHDLVAKTPDGRWQLVELKNLLNRRVSIWNCGQGAKKKRFHAVSCSEPSTERWQS